MASLEKEIEHSHLTWNFLVILIKWSLTVRMRLGLRKIV